MGGGGSDETSTTGAVELREDIPLTHSAYQSFGSSVCRYFGGIRFIIGCFSLLTAAITVALITQIYYGDYELVPHGSVACDAKQCSLMGTDALKAGGGAVDAAIAAAFCLAVVEPHNTGLDAGGTLLLYEYRSARSQGPLVADWSAGSNRSGSAAPLIPRMVAGLAYLHAQYGRVPWSRLVTPAAQLARSGFLTSNGLVAAISRYSAVEIYGPLVANQSLKMAALADYLDTVASRSSQDLSADAFTSDALVIRPASRAELGGFILFTPDHPAAMAVVAVLREVLAAEPLSADPDQLVYRAAFGLQQNIIAGKWVPGSTVSSNIAVIDNEDVYVSLVSGMSFAFGSRQLAPGGFLLDPLPVFPLMPVILTQNYTCGTRYVLGSGDVSTATQVVASLVATDDGLIPSVERPRFKMVSELYLALEGDHEPIFSTAALAYLSRVGVLQNFTEPYDSCNVVQQLGDALTSHADSRGGGTASRF